MGSDPEKSNQSKNIPNAANSENNLSLQITSFKLSGSNYLQWSRSVQLVIRGKGKYGYIDVSIEKPLPTDPSCAEWDIQNSMVMAWLINSMQDGVAEIYFLYPTTKSIWDVVTRSYSDLEVSSQMFELQTKARNLRQDTEQSMRIQARKNALSVRPNKMMRGGDSNKIGANVDIMYAFECIQKMIFECHRLAIYRIIVVAFMIGKCAKRIGTVCF